MQETPYVRRVDPFFLIRLAPIVAIHSDGCFPYPIARVHLFCFACIRVLACISHHPTAEARDRAARTSLRLLVVLNVLFKYACARQAARASS